MTEQPFSELTVIEIASVLAGPSVGMFFAEMGARVIKVENKTAGGDITRKWKLPSENPSSNISAYFSSVNWHKEHIFLDFTDPDELKKLYQLIAKADILIANFKKGDDLKFKLSFEDVRTINEQIIYGRITGFGPDSERIAYDLVLQAETGWMSMNGNETSGPIKVPVAIIDLFAGHQLREGLLTAMLLHQKNPKAYLVDVSLFDAAVASLANQATNWLMGQHVPQRIGSKHPNIAPYGELFETSDGQLITFAIGSDKQFSKLTEELGLENLSNDSRFDRNAVRVQNRSELAEILEKVVRERSATDLVKKLKEKHVPVAEIKDIRQVFEDPKAARLVLEEEVENQLTRRAQSTIFRITN